MVLERSSGFLDCSGQGPRDGLSGSLIGWESIMGPEDPRSRGELISRLRYFIRKKSKYEKKLTDIGGV